MTTSVPQGLDQAHDVEPGTGALMQVDDLSLSIPSTRGDVRAVNDVSFTLVAGEAIGIVGESGCGKSQMCRAVMGLTPPLAERTGQVHFDGEDLVAMSPKELRDYWGKEIAVIFQDAMTALNPVVRIGRQVSEGIREHMGLSRSAAKTAALELLRAVGIPEPEKRYRQYPHQLSGGMVQRASIAVALACQPRLLIADEPTTALDVTLQQQVLDLIQAARRHRNMSLMLVTHDMGVAAANTDKLAVMYASRVVEIGPTAEVLTAPSHPYTLALLRSNPHLDSGVGEDLQTIPGRPPDLAALPQGCAFAARCERAQDRCRSERPELTTQGSSDHAAACWFPVHDTITGTDAAHA